MALVVVPHLNSFFILLCRSPELLCEVLEGHVGGSLGVNGPGQFIIRERRVLRIKFANFCKAQHFFSFVISSF